MSVSRFRLGFKFWLNIDNPQEQALANEIEELKESRSFTRSIRDGLRLICDLKKGRIEVLNELFPWVLEQSNNKLALLATGGNFDNLNRDEALSIQLKRLETLILQNQQASASPHDRGLSALQAPSNLSLAPPKDTKTELNFKVEVSKSSADTNPSWNLMIASTLQIYGDVSILPDDILRYGLRTGRIKPALLPAEKRAQLSQNEGEKSSPEPEKTPKISGTGGPKAMDVPQFSPPTFEDDDLDLGFEIS